MATTNVIPLPRPAGPPAGHHPSLGTCVRCGSTATRPITGATAITCDTCGAVVSLKALAAVRTTAALVRDDATAVDELLGELARASAGRADRHLQVVTS